MLVQFEWRPAAVNLNRYSNFPAPETRIFKNLATAAHELCTKANSGARVAVEKTDTSHGHVGGKLSKSFKRV